MEAGDWCEFFTVAVRHIFSFYSCDKKCESHVLLFTSIKYERKHVSDLSMLVFGFHGHTFMVYLQTTKVHNSVFKELTLHFLLQKFPHAFGFPIVNTPPPLPSDFHNHEPPPPPFGNQNPKSRPWYSMDIFWNRPIR